MEKIKGTGKGVSILVHVGSTNAERKGKTIIVDIVRKQTRVEQIIISGILPVVETNGQGYRSCRLVVLRVASNRSLVRKNY